MIPQFVYVAGILLVVLAFGGKKVFSENPWIRKNNVLLEGSIFAVLFLLFAMHFYERELYAGMIAVAMGAMAIVKYLSDKKSEPEEDSE